MDICKIKEGFYLIWHYIEYILHINQLTNIFYVNQISQVVTDIEVFKHLGRFNTGTPTSIVQSVPLLVHMYQLQKWNVNCFLKFDTCSI